MKDLFVPFETAVKLKDKGFDEPCYACYYIQNKNLEWSTMKKPNGYKFNSESATEISAPIFQQVLDWLREVHHLHIYIVPYGDKESWHIANIGYTNRDTHRLILEARFLFEDIKFPDYYSALQSGIEKALDLI